MSVEVRPATGDHWDDLCAVFGSRAADPSWCWCQLFVRPRSGESPPSAPERDNRTSLYEELTTAAVPPGLLAYVDGRPAGWTRVGPRRTFPGVSGNKALAKVLPDDPGAWWITCFAVANRHRRSGVGSALLHAAVEFAHEHGATAVEGHPVDVNGLKSTRVAGSAIYTGTVAMFAAAGFVEVVRTYPTRPVMRLPLGHQGRRRQPRMPP